MSAPKKPPTRDELVEQLAVRHRLTKKTSRELLDQVLDEVIVMAKPKLENEWTGSDVLHQLYAWRGGR